MCARWVIWALKGKDTWKVLPRNYVCPKILLGKRSYKGLTLAIIIITPTQVKIKGTFITQNI